jgi:D-alanine--poly(phosphoribitol) ligase subunit 1
MANIYHYNLAIRFQALAEHYARRTALWFDAQNSVTYAELNRLANRLATLLIEQGVAAGDVVCISGFKSVYTFGLMLACLKVGAPYSVFDPDSPVERVRKILSTCRPKRLIAEQSLIAKLSDVLTDLEIVPIEKDAEKLEAAIKDRGAENLVQTRQVTGANPAYIMYTSGSTGFPKGAVMTHANVLNLIEWSRETYSITSDDVLTNVNPLYFDNSVFDFYSALFTGTALVPFSKEEVRDPRLLVEKVEAGKCTLWFSVPSLLIFLQTMKAADGKRLRTIRRFVFGGEGYPKAKLKKLYDAYSDSTELFNVYGPTECTCICSSYKLSAVDFEDVLGLPPLGYIAENFAFLILDPDGKLVPAGETGELCLLGPNVGKGYYNDPMRTAASFVQNPYNDKFQEIMYKTGDLVRLDPADGKLYICGRKDNQIKHMGYRIELGEIEAAMHCLEYISEAAAFHSRMDGLSRIVAVVASREEVGDDRIRADLRRIIPDYMIPSTIYREVMLPKNQNGKVDRSRLAEKYLQQPT